MSSPQRVVVVGNGIAGLTAADSLRAEGYDGELVVVGDEPHAAYSRPALSKALLREPTEVSAHLLPSATHGATELLGVSAAGLEVNEGAVLLDDGARLPYDGLVIATGCRARRLGLLGPSGPREVTLRTIDDAWQLRGRVVERPAVVVVGGGPLGMEIASSCLEAGCEVTLVSQGPPLARQLGAYLSEVFSRAALARGLRIVCTTDARVVGIGEDTRVVLADGTEIEAGLVVTAVGDRPNTEWLASSGLLRDGALLTDERGRVRRGIVAAGDVATVPTPLGARRVPIWSAAIDQAKTAAATLVRGVEAPLRVQQPYFWTEQFGLSLKAVGHLPLTGRPTVIDGGPDQERSLLRWGEPGTEAVVAINYRIPIPKMRGLRDAVA